MKFFIRKHSIPMPGQTKEVIRFAWLPTVIEFGSAGWYVVWLEKYKASYIAHWYCHEYQSESWYEWRLLSRKPLGLMIQQ